MQVGRHADCNKSIPMPNGGTEGDEYVTNSMVLTFINTSMKSLAEDGSIKQNEDRKRFYLIATQLAGGPLITMS